MRCILLLVMIALSGCALSSGVLPMGPDTYMIAEEGGSFCPSVLKLKSEALSKASAFCSESKKEMLVVNTHENSCGVGIWPRAEIQFMCLNSGDPDLQRPRLVPVANQVIEMRH